MKRLGLKRLRREIQKSEARVAERAASDFKRFVNKLPLIGRIRIAWKVLKGAL